MTRLGLVSGFVCVELVVEAKSERVSCLESVAGHEKDLLKLLLSRLSLEDEDANRDVVLEVRPGTGGEEAALFAADVFHMYHKFALLKRWTFDILDIQKTTRGGFKEASAVMSGSGVYLSMRHESGVHRVQRVPMTENSGRIHTSTVTVAVLPSADDDDIKIHDSDLRIDVYRASGNGGQSVNTTDSAVRVIHLPTGTTVCMQDERSQHQNKAKALQVLRARLYDTNKQEKLQQRRSNRAEQIGSGDRSERIRTYNYQQQRVTDHRCNISKHSIDRMLSGQLLDNFHDDLSQKIRMEHLALLTNNH